MSLNDSEYFTNVIKLYFFDINSSKIRDFKEGTKFKVNKISSNYNDYYKTYTYHVRAYEKTSNSNCIFTCSRKENSKEVTFYNSVESDAYLKWSSVFKEKCPIK